MAAGEDKSSKTEKPTPKRVKDARKKGDLARSKDATMAASWIGGGLGLLALGWLLQWQVLDLLEKAVTAPLADSLGARAQEIARDGGLTLVAATALVLAGAASFALGAEWLQIGPLFTFEKLKLDVKHLNPVEGVKRLFNWNNLFETCKSLMKVGLVAAALALTAREFARDILLLPLAEPQAFGGVWLAASIKVFIYVAAVFLGVAGLDVWYQKQQHLKKLRMSQRELRREYKEQEGDPQLKRQRKALHKDWSERSPADAARTARALVVNPTHIAVALTYDPAALPAPVCSAKGEGAVALAMREAAAAAGVPILHNVWLARSLFEQAMLDEYIPESLFTAVAEVIAWADALAASRPPEAAP